MIVIKINLLKKLYFNIRYGKFAIPTKKYNGGRYEIYNTDKIKE